jgi:hypothetical protein
MRHRPALDLRFETAQFSVEMRIVAQILDLGAGV